MLVQPGKRRFTVEEFHRYRRYEQVERVERGRSVAPAAFPDIAIALDEIL